MKDNRLEQIIHAAHDIAVEFHDKEPNMYYAIIKSRLAECLQWLTNMAEDEEMEAKFIKSSQMMGNEV